MSLLKNVLTYQLAAAQSSENSSSSVGEELGKGIDTVQLHISRSIDGPRIASEVTNGADIIASTSIQGTGTSRTFPNVFRTLKNVHNTKSMSGEEFNQITAVFYVCNCGVSLAIFGLLYWLVSSKYDEDKSTTVWPIVGTLFLVMLVLCQIGATVGYCIYRRKEILPKSRMVEHMIILCGLSVALVLVSYLELLESLGILTIAFASKTSLFGCVEMVLIQIYLSALVSRQRLIYSLFQAQSVASEGKLRFYYIPLLVLTIFAILLIIPYRIVVEIEDHAYAALVGIFEEGWCLVLLGTLIFYTWRSRHIKAFSDWRCNLRVGITILSTVTALYILHYVWLDDSHKDEEEADPHLVDNHLPLVFVELWMVSVTIVDMYGVIAYVVWRDLKLVGMLHPGEALAAHFSSKRPKDETTVADPCTTSANSTLEAQHSPAVDDRNTTTTGSILAHTACNFSKEKRKSDIGMLGAIDTDLDDVPEITTEIDI